MFNSLEVSNTQAAVPDHLKSDVLRGMREAKLMLRRAFSTQNIHTFGVLGTRWSSIDCMLSAVLPDDKAIIFVNNSFSRNDGLALRMKTSSRSDLAANVVDTQPDNVIIINTPHGESITSEIIEAALATYRPKWAMMAHCETSPGHFNDLEGFSDACLKHNTMGLINAVASLNTADFSIDDYLGIVAWASCPQPSLPLTYAPVSLTDKYIETIRQNGVYSYKHHPVLEAGYWGITDGTDSEITSTYNCAHSRDAVSAFHEILRTSLKQGQVVPEDSFKQSVAA